MNFLLLPFFWLSVMGGVNLEVVRLPKEFIPGKHQMVIFKITNDTETDITTPNLELELPKGWSVVTKPSRFNLKTGTSKRLLYTIALPRSASFGEGKITLSVSQEALLLTKKEILVNVKKVHKIELNVYDKPKYIKDGDDFDCKYMLINKGNVDEPLQLISRNGIILDKASIKIPVDSSKIITVKQIIPKSNKIQIVINDISVFIQEADTTYSKNVPLTVYPNQSKRDNVYHRFPLEGAFSYNTINNSVENLNFLQFNIKGQGYIDREKKHRLELVTTGTDKSKIKRFETLNRYYVKYSYKSSTIHAGDFTLGVSRLLENIRLGRGIIYDQQIGKFNVSSFYNQLLFFPEIKSQFGNSLSFIPNERLNFKFNNLYRNYADRKDNSYATSVIGKYTKENFVLESEYAMSFQNSKTGFGTILTGQYKKERYQMTGNFMFTGQDFEGYFNNSTFISTSFNYRLSHLFRISTRINYNFVNPKADAITAQIAPFYQIYSSSIGYSKNKNQSHKFTYLYRNNEDRSDVKKFSYNEHTIRYSYRYKSEKFNLQFSGGVSETENKRAELELQKKMSLQSTLNCNYSAFKKLRFGAFLDYSKTNRYSSESIDYLFYGASAYYNPNNKFQFNINYRNNFPLEELYKSNSFFNLDTSYKLNVNHSVALFANYSQPSGSSEKDIFMSLRYNAKLNVPLSKDKNLGNVIGRIKALDSSSVEGIVVNLNQYSTITTADGLFSFNDLKPKKYYLTLDQLSYNNNYITQQELPLEIDVVPQTTEDIIIDLLKPVRINGTITYKKSKQIQSDEFKNKLPQLIVKLENGVDKFYTMMNDKGKFNFSEIRPGDWTLSIVTKGLEDKFTFLDNNKTLTLESGADENINFIVKDKSRRMRFKKSKIKLKVGN